MDVTDSVSFIINWLISEILYIWNTMQNIEFLGTNLLVFTVTITILGAMMPVLITATQIHKTNVGREIRRR